MDSVEVFEDFKWPSKIVEVFARNLLGGSRRKKCLFLFLFVEDVCPGVEHGPLIFISQHTTYDCNENLFKLSF